MKPKRKILLYSIKIPNKRLPYTNGGSLIIDSDKYILKYFGTLHTFEKKNTKFEKLENYFIYCSIRIYDNVKSYELIVSPYTMDKLEQVVDLH
ncbi:MAG: hypothetical protein ACLUFN_00385 [Eubacterium sp.]